MTTPKIKRKPGSNTKRSVWLSYDLGLRGDYSGLYAWLDNHGALECGDATAYLLLEPKGADISEWLTNELAQHVKLSPKDRIYAIYHEGLKMKGKFISGGRRRAPWEGYGQQEVAEDTEDAA